MTDDPTPRWLEWAREIQALAQTGQAFTKSHYDRLSFERLSGPWKQRAVSPAQVPPVLLAEAYNDYLAVAAHGAFDADWEAKMPW